MLTEIIREYAEAHGLDFSTFYNRCMNDPNTFASVERWYESTLPPDVEPMTDETAALPTLPEVTAMDVINKFFKWR